RGLRQKQAYLTRRIGALILQGQDDQILGLLDFDNARIAEQIDVLAQQQPEWCLIECDPVIRLDIQILNGEHLAVRDNELPARAIVFEPQPPWTLDEEIAAHPLVIGCRLNKRAAQILEP